MQLVNKTSFLVILCATAFSMSMLLGTKCLASDIPLPKGWRLLKSSEIQDKWRDKDANRYLVVKADFNGDGIVDQARLLIRDKPPAFGLFAFIGQKDGKFKSFVLYEMNESEYLESYLKTRGIIMIRPGTYLTACGKGIVDCSPTLSEKVVIQHDSIEHFKYDAGERTFFYWDESSKDFKGVPIDD